MVSQKLRDAIKTNIDPAYVIGKRLGMSQSMISQLLNNILETKDGDERIIAIGKEVGLKPEECFD